MENSTLEAQFRESEASLERAGRIEDLIRLYENRAREIHAAGEAGRLLARAGELAWEKLRDFPRAEDLLRRAHLISPSDKAPLLALKSLYEQKQDPEGLADALERLARTGRGPESAALYLRAADLHEQKLGRRDRAFLCLQFATRADPQSREAWERIRRILMADMKLVPAFECLERQRAAMGASGLADAYAQIAEAAIDDPQMHEIGIRAVEMTLSLEGQHARALAARKSIERAPDNWKARVRVLRQESLDERDRRKAAYLSLGVARLHAAFDPKGKQKLQDALDRCFLLWPAMPDAITLMVNTAAQKGDLPRAEQSLEKMAGAYRERSAQVDLWIHLGMLRLTRKGDSKGALAAFERATQIDPARADAVSLAAELYLEGGRAPEAMALYERHLATVKDRPRQVELRLGLARLYQTVLKDVPAARRQLEAAVQADPHSADAAFELCLLHAKAQDLDALLPQLELALCAEKPVSARIALCEQVAALANERGRPALAYDTLSRVLVLDPLRPGLLQSASGAAQTAHAELRFAEALKLAAQGESEPAAAATLWRNLAQFLQSPLSKPEEAKEAWSQVVKLVPGDPQASDALRSLQTSASDTTPGRLRAELEAEAKRLEAQGADPRAAAEVYWKILELDPEDRTALRRLGAASAALEKWDEVAIVTARLAELAPSPEEGNEWRARLAQVYSERLGRKEEAADIYLALLAEGVRTQGLLHGLEKLARARVREAEISRALAPLYADNGDYPRQAASLLVQLSTSADRTEQKTLLAVLAVMHERHLMDSRAALSFWLRALALDPEELESRREAVRVARDLQAELEVSRALVTIASRVTDARLASSLFVEAAELADDAHSPEEAVRALQSALMSLPDDAGIFSRLVVVLRAAGRLPDCEQLLERRLAEADQAERAELLLELSRVRAEMGRPLEAAHALAEAIGAGAPEAEHLPALIELYTKAGRMTELSRALARQIELSQKAGDAEGAARLSLRRAQVLDAALGDRTAAVKDYSEILARRPSDPDALAALEALLEDPSCAAEVARALAPAYEATQDHRKVALVLDRLAQTSQAAGEQVSALRKAAEVYQLHLRQPEMAFAALVRAVRISPLDGRLRMAARMAADDADMLVEYAEQLAERAQEAEGDVAVQAALHRELAELYDKKLQDRQKAVAHHRAVLAVDPANIDALRALQRLHRAGSEWAALVEMLEAFAGVTADPLEKTTTWREAAQLHEHKLTDGESAAAAWRRVAELDPLDREAALALDRLYSSQGKTEDLAFALELRRAQEGHSPQGREATFRLAQLRQGALADENAALVLYRQILEHDPGHGATREALELWAHSDAPLGQAALEALDPVLARSGDHPRRIAIREARLEFALPEERARLFQEIRRIAEQDLRQPDLAFRVALTAFAQDTDREGVQPEMERLAGVINGWNEVAEAYEHAAEQLGPGDSALSPLLRRAAQVREQLGQADEATRLWKQLMDEAPQDREALEALGRLYEKAKNARKLSEVYARQAQLAQDPVKRCELLLKSGGAYEAAGDDAEAVETYQSVLGIAPSVEALDALDRLFARLKRTEEQAEVLHQLAELAIDPTAKKDYLLRRAAILEKAGAHPEAVDLYAQVLGLASGDASALAGLERLFPSELVRARVAELLEPPYRAANETRKLVEVLDVRLAQDAEGDRLARVKEIAALRESLGDTSLAFAARLRAFAESPEDQEVRSELERLAAATGDFEQLVGVYEDRIERGASDALLLELWRSLASIYSERLGRPELAARALEEVSRRVPSDLTALDGLARLYRKTNAPRELADVMRRQIEAQPSVEEQVRLLFELGTLAEEQLQDLRTAATSYQGVVERVPSDLKAIQLLGRVLQVSERWGELAQLTERESQLARERGAQDEAQELMVRLGRLRVHRLGDPRGALEAFQAVLQSDPQHPGAVAGLEEMARTEGPLQIQAAGVLEPVFTRAGEYLRLVQILEWRVTAELVPEERAQVLRRMAEIFARHLQSPEQAFITASRALRDAPDDIAALELCLKNATLADAEDALVDLLDEVVERASVPEVRAAEYRALGEAKERQGNLTGAVDAFTAVLSIAPSVEALRALDHLFGRLDRREEQAEVLGKLAELATDPELQRGYLLRRAALLENAGAHEDAVELYARVLGLAAADESAVAGLERLFTSEAVRSRAAGLLESVYRAANEPHKLADVLDVRLEQEMGEGRLSLLQEIAALREALDQGALAFSARLRAFSEKPEDAGVRSDVERLAAASGSFEELAAAYENRIEQGASDDLSVELWRRLGWIYSERLGRRELGARALEEVSRRAPRDLAVLDALARLYREADAPRELADVMQRQIEAHPSVKEQVNLLFELGNLAEEQLQDLGMAATCYAAILERKPHDSTALELLDRALELSERWPELAQLIEREIQLAQKRGARRDTLDLAVRLGRLRIERLDDARAGLDAFLAVLAANPEHPGAVAALERMAQADGVLGDEAALALEPVFARSGDYLRLVQLLEWRLSAESGPEERARLLRRMAEIYAQHLDSPEQAFIMASRALRDAPDDAAALSLCLANAAPADAEDALVELLDEVAARSTVAEVRLAEYCALGEAKERQGDAVGAVEAFVAVLSIGQNLQALESLDRLYGELGRDDEQAEVLSQLLELTTEPETQKEYFLRRGGLLEKAGAHEQAVELYARVLGLAPDDASAVAGLERLFTSETVRGRVAVLLEPVYRAAKKTRKLTEVLDVRLAEETTNEDRLALIEEIAVLRESLGDKSVAFSARLRAFAENPEDATVRSELERLAAATGAFEELAAAYEDRIERGASDALSLELWRKLGSIYSERLGQVELAARALEEVSRRTPTDLDALATLALLYREANAPRELADVMQRQIQAQPAVEHQVNLLFELGQLAEEQLLDLGMAAECYAAVLERKPGDPTALELLGRVLQVSERWEELARLIEQKIQLAQEGGGVEEALDLTVRLGRLRVERLADPEGGLEAFRAVLQHQLQHPGAVAALEEMAQGDTPQRGEAALALEHVFTQAADHLRLVQVLEWRVSAEEVPEERAKLLRRIGELFAEHLDSPEQAFITATRALRDAPDDSEALQLALRNAAQADADDALVELLEEVAERSSVPEVRAAEYRALGAARERQGDLAGAVDAYTAVLSVGPSIEALKALDDLLARLERPDEQANVLAQLAELATDPESQKDYLLRRAALLERAGAHEEAFDLYERVLGFAPGDAGAVAGLERLFTSDPVRAPVAALLEPIYRAAADAPKLADVLDVRLAQDSDENRLQLIQEIAALRESLGENALAFSAWLRAFVESPEDLQVRTELERLTAATGAFEELAAAYEDCIERGASDELALELWRKLAWTYSERLGRVDLAARALEEVTRAVPTDLDALDALAQLYRESNSPRELAEVMRRQINAQPSVEEQVNLLFELGNLAEDQLEDLGIAAKCYGAILERRPNDLNAFQLLGRVLYASERWEDLVRLTHREIQLAVERGALDEALDLTVRLGRIRVQRLGDQQGGIEAFQEVLKRRPHHAGAIAGLEELARSDSPLRGEAALALEPVFTSDGDYLRLVTVLESRVSTENSPEERAKLLRRMAEIYAEHLDSPEQAFITAARALRDVPDDGAALKLCLGYAAPGDAEEALVELLEEVSVRANVPQIRLAEYRALGLAKERQGDVRGATEAWKQVFEAEPDHTEAVDALVRLLPKQNRAPELLEVLRRQLSILEDPEVRALRMFQIGALQDDALHDPDGALVSFRRLLEFRPDDPPTLERVDALCSRLARWPELADVLSRRIDLAAGGEATELRHRLALVREERLSDRTGALDLYAEILVAVPTHEGALSKVEAMVERDRHNLAASDVLLRAYRDNGDLSKLAALLDARSGAADDPSERKAYLLELAELRAKQEEPELAFMALLRAFRDDPNDPAVRHRLEAAADAARTWDELVGVYEGDLDRIAEPKDAADVCLRLGEILEERLSHPERAVEFLERARSLDPDVLPKVLPSLERLYQQLNRPLELAEVLERLAELAPDPKERAAQLFRLGQIAQETLKEPERATRAYEGILALEPNHLATARLLEQLYEELGRADDLYRILEHQRDRLQGQERERIFVKMAKVSAESLSDSSRSIDIYREILAKNPRNEQAWTGLQEMLESAGRGDELRELLVTRLKQTVDPREVVRIHNRLGRVVWKLAQKPDEAVAHFKAVLERDPRNKSALESLRDIYEGADRKAELVGALRRLVALQEDAQGVKRVRIRLAEVLAGMSRREEALDAARRSLEVEPHHPDDLRRVGQVFQSLRAFGDAMKTLELRAAAEAEHGQPEQAVATLFEVAELCKGSAQKPDRAAPALHRVLELDPANQRAYELVRELSRKSNDWASWAQVTDRFLPHIASEEEKLATLRELAQVQEHQLGQKDVAFLTACRTLQLDAANHQLRQEVERLADETGSHEEVAAVYEELADGLPRGPVAESLYLTLANVQDQRLDDASAAEASLRKILDFDPTNAAALDALAAMYARRGRDQDYLVALEQHLEVAESTEHRKALLREIARLHDEKLGNPVEAAAALQRSLELEEDPATLKVLVELYRREKSWPDVAQTLGRWRDVAPTPEERARLQTEVAAVYEREIADEEAAIDAYREALEFDPHSQAAVESLERLFGKLDRPADLLAVYQRQLDATEEPRQRVELLFKCASIWEDKLQNPASAAECMEGALAAEPQNLEAIEKLERLWRNAENWTGLVEVLERHLALPGSNVARAALCVEMAEVLRNSLRQADTAVDAYQRALELDRDNRAALHALGELYERSGNWPFALEMLGREAELSGRTPEAVELYHRIGKIYDEMLMDASNARGAYESALRIDPGFLPSLRALKQIHERAEDWDAYERTLQQEARETTDAEAKARTLVELARYLLERKEDPEGATRNFEEAAKHAPDLLEAALPMSDVYVAREDWSQAERMLDTVVVKIADKASAEQDEVLARELCGQLYRLGYVAEKLQKKDKALASYEKAYKLDPTYLPALEGLGHLLVEHQRYEEALKAYHTILLHHREELTDLEVVEIYWQLGEIHEALQQQDQAQTNFEKALAIDPGHDPSLKALIRIADASGRWEASAEYRQSLVTVLEGDAKFQSALELAILVSDKLSDPYRAIDAYQVAHRLRPESLEVMDSLYVLLRETKQSQKAVEILEKMLGEPSIQKSPKLKNVWFAVGEISRDELNDVDRATKAFNAALDADHRFVEAFSALEQLLASEKKWKLLEENYARMIQRVPKTPDTHAARMTLWRTLGDLYRQVLKDDDGALMAYQVVAAGLPDDGAVQEVFAELASRKPGHEAKALEAWRRALPSSSDPGKVVSALSALQAKRKEYDQAWLAAQVAHGFIGQVGEAEQEILTKLGPYAKKREQATNSLTDRQWRTHLFHPKVRGHLTDAMALLFEQVGHHFAVPHSQYQINPKRHRIDVATAQVLQVHQYRYVARLLGMEAMELYSPYLVATLERVQKRSNEPAPEPMVGIELCQTHPVCLKVGGKFFPRESSGQSQKELLYQLGRTLALARPELALSQRLPPDRLDALLQAAVSLSVPRFPFTADRKMLEDMRRLLEKGLTPQARMALAREIGSWLPQSSTEDLTSYLEGAELTAVRTGLFVANEAEPVKRMVLGETGTAFRVPPRTKVRELMVFALSEDLHALRVVVGTNVEVAPRAAASR